MQATLLYRLGMTIHVISRVTIIWPGPKISKYAKLEIYEIRTHTRTNHILVLTPLSKVEHGNMI